MNKVQSAEPFEPISDPVVRREAAELGMWLFLATEFLFFGALILGYSVYRFMYAAPFEAASHLLDAKLGAVNTGVLLTSSLFVAYGVRAARLGRFKRSAWLLIATVGLAAAFLCIKGVEWTRDYHEHLIPGAGFHFDGADAAHVQLFFFLYFCMTGLHALHILIGIALLGGLSGRLLVNSDPARLTTAVEVIGLYWHFVDLVWVFLFPLLYLIGVRHG